MAKAGKVASVWICAGPSGFQRVAGMSTFTLEPEADELDVTSFDSPQGFREYLLGLKAWSGTVEGNFEGLSDPSVQAVFNAYLNDTKVRIRFGFDPGPSSFIEGEAYVVPNSLAAPVEEKQSLSIRVRGTGPFTVVPA